MSELTNDEKMIRRIRELHALGYVNWNVPRMILDHGGCVVWGCGYYTLSEAGWMLLSAVASEHQPIRKDQLRKTAS